jgi:CRISPR-associated protein (TIGR02584 family)
MTTLSQQPEHYSKRVLLVVIGMTPQIVTETLYKLAVDSDPLYIPTEIHLITTKEGANSAKIALLGTANDKGWFYTFCEDYGISDISFNKDNIHIIADTEGQFIDDNQSSEHNKIASDFITNKVKEFTQDSSTSLHVSLAGGRKTMSYYAGYALSLYGRWQDRLSHVLVNMPFMNNKDFFYPRPKAQRFVVDNRHYSTDEANIILSDIPYVRMRYQVPEALLEGTAGFQETVAKIQKFNEAPSVELFIKQRKIEFNGVALKLAPADFAFYIWMCKRKQTGLPPLILDADEFMSEYLEAYAHFTNPNGGNFEKVEIIANEKSAEEQKNWFEARKSTLHKKIINALGDNLAQAFLIRMVEHKQSTAFQIEIPAKRIKIIKAD